MGLGDRLQWSEIPYVQQGLVTRGGSGGAAPWSLRGLRLLLSLLQSRGSGCGFSSSLSSLTTDIIHSCFFFPGGPQSGSEAMGPWGRLGRSGRSLPTRITLASCPLQLPAYLRKRGVNTE